MYWLIMINKLSKRTRRYAVFRKRIGGGKAKKKNTNKHKKNKKKKKKKT